MKPYILTLSLLTGLAPNAFAQALSEFETFRTFPYLDKGYRAAKQNDWSEVERLMRHALERVPQHLEARGLLVQALTQQQRYAEAARETETLTGTPEGAHALFELRQAWITQHPPAADVVETWLRDSAAPERQRLWQAYSLALAERQGDAAALRWMLQVPGEEDETLHRWRATSAEKLGNWPEVISQLAPLQQNNRLTEQDWTRLGQAYAQQQDDAALRHLLTSAPTPEAAAALRRLAGERAIAQNRTEAAKAWLLEQQGEATLDDTQRQSLWELARQSRDSALVVSLGDVLQYPCLETVDWLSRHDRPAALAKFKQCSADSDPQQWLTLAQRLQATEALAAQRLTEPWERQRRSILLNQWLAQGKNEQVLDWLAAQPQDAHVLQQQAMIRQRLGQQRAAAQLWEQLHERNGSPQALDQASFLWLGLGEPQRAQNLLERAQQRGTALPASAQQRLAELYAGQQTTITASQVEPLLNQVNADTRGLLLARLADNGGCATVQRNTGKQPREFGQLRALASCALPERPTEAAAHYRRAVELGDSASSQPLAYALDAAGDPAAAHLIWQAYPTAKLDNDARLAAARSALAADQLTIAQDRWHSAEAHSAAAWSLGAAIAMAQKQPKLALQRQRLALAQAPVAEQYYAAAVIASAADEPDQSLEWLREAVRLAPEEPRYRADYAMRMAVAAEPGQREQSIPLLQQAIQDYPKDYLLAETLAMRHNEAGESAAARAQLRRAIDLESTLLEERGAPTLAQGSPDAESIDLEKRRYRQRRANEALSRRDSITLASTWSPVGVAGSGASAGSSAENIQVASWDHALGEEPSTAGRSLSVYGRALLGSGSRNRYGETLGTGIGLRYKPFGELNLNLYGELYSEGQLKSQAGQPRDKGVDVDFLLRASASLFDQGEYRNDWRTDQSNWNERSLYLDAAWWTKRGEHQLLARYQQGRAYKLPFAGAQTLMPYAMLQLTSQETDDWREDLRTGLGVRWQLWSHEDRYTAYRGRLSMRLEYQQALGGTLYGGENGWLSALELNF